MHPGAPGIPVRQTQIALCLVLLVGALGISSACSTTASTSPDPTKAASLRFTAEYADAGVHVVKVSYTDSAGKLVRQNASTPWISPKIIVAPGHNYDLTVDGPREPAASLTCGATTSTGHVLSNSVPSGHCSYSYPHNPAPSSPPTS
jgi:hypothetical protein